MEPEADGSGILAPDATTAGNLMNDDQLLRYSRQILLPQVGMEGQQALLDAHVTVIGMGGLGAPAAIYLAAGGVGRLTLVDFDAVDLSNLQRQIVHTTADVGRPKVESARDALAALNPEVEIATVQERLDRDGLAALAERSDLLVDACDNFETRFLLNEVCHATKTPLVSGAVIRLEGQVSVFTHDGTGPCYRCLYREEGGVAESCSENGILAPVAGLIGCTEAVEAMKLLLGLGEPLSGRLLILDAVVMEWRTLKLARDPDCAVCGTGH